jgi:uncharacterized protein with beta-barrel porin domain
MLRAAWVHEFNPERDLQAQFQSARGTSFRVEGAPAPEDAAQIQAGAELILSSRVSISAQYVGKFSDSSRSHGGFGGIKILW